MYLDFAEHLKDRRIHQKSHIRADSCNAWSFSSEGRNEIHVVAYENLGHGFLSLLIIEVPELINGELL